MVESSARFACSSDCDFYSAMITRPPLFGCVKCCDLYLLGNALGGKYEIHLPSRRGWGLSVVVKSRNILAVRGKFLWPRIGAASSRCLRSYKRQAHGFHSVEHTGVADLPVGTSMLPMPVQDVEIASGDDVMPRLVANKCGQIGNHTVGRGICISYSPAGPSRSKP